MACSKKEVLSTLSYTVVERYIEKFEQKLKTVTHTITLDAEMIKTANASYPMKEVIDVSYKPFSSNKGLFYLHTNQGVITFQIEVSPTEFIKTFKALNTL